MEHFFTPNSGEDLRSDKLNYWGDISPPSLPGFGTPDRDFTLVQSVTPAKLSYGRRKNLRLSLIIILRKI